MTILRWLAGALLAVGATASPSEPAAAPASEALVERFMTVIPDAESLDRIDTAANPEQLARLSALNPGRTEEIRPLLEAYSACVSPLRNRMNASGLRAAARELGEERLGRLVAFYQSEDWRRFSALTDRTERGETLTAAERAEGDRIVAAYPLAEFYESMQQAVWREEALTLELIACDDARDAELERLGLRLFGETAEDGAEEDETEE